MADQTMAVPVRLFISYSRKDKEFTLRLNGALESLGFSSWVDWADILPSADWWQAIEKGIEEADAFLFLISPDSVSSEVCSREIEHAVRNGKRMIPIVVRDVNQQAVHEVLGKLNWLFFRASDSFDDSLEKLKTGILSDFDWMGQHRRLQMRALDWQKNRDTSHLLRGKELARAEEQMAGFAPRDPRVTDAQRAFVHESRLAENRRRRLLLVSATALGVILALLAAAAVWQAGLAMTRDAEKGRALAGLYDSFAQKALDARDYSVAAQWIAKALEASDDHAARLGLGEVLDYASGIEGTLRGPTAFIACLAVSLDGKNLAGGCADGTITFWNSTTGTGHNFKAGGVANDLAWVGPDRLAVAFDDGRVAFFRLDDAVWEPGFQVGTNCRALIWSPTDELLIAAGGDGEIVCWSANHNSVIKTKAITDSNGNNPGIACLALDRKTGRLLAGTGDGLLVSLEWPGLAEKERSSNGNRWVASTVALCETGSWLSGGSEGRLALHRSGSDAVQTLFQAPETAINVIACLRSSPDGKLVGAAFGDGTIQLRDGTDGSLVEILRGHRTVVRSLAFSSDGKRLYSAGNDGLVRVWCLRSSLAAPRTAEPPGPRGPGFDPDALAKAAPWLPAADSGAVPTAAAFSPDKHWLAWGATDMKLRLVNLENPGDALIREGHGSDLTGLLFSPDSKSLVSAGQDGTLFVWHLPDLKHHLSLPGHQASITGLAADPEFRLLFSVAVGEPVRVWNLETGTLLKTLRTSINWPSSLAYDAEGSRLWFKSAFSENAESHPLLLDQTRDTVRQLARSWVQRFTAFTLDSNGNPSFDSEAGPETLRQAVDSRLFAPWYDNMPTKGLINPDEADRYDQSVREALDKAIRSYNDEWLMQYAA